MAGGGGGGGKAGSDDLGLASLVSGAVGLSISMVLLFGPRGIGVSLGIIALVLGFISYRRSGADQGRRGMAYGSLALGAVTLAVALWVALSP